MIDMSLRQVFIVTLFHFASGIESNKIGFNFLILKPLTLRKNADLHYHNFY